MKNCKGRDCKGRHKDCKGRKSNDCKGRKKIKPGGKPASGHSKSLDHPPSGATVSGETDTAPTFKGGNAADFDAEYGNVTGSKAKTFV